MRSIFALVGFLVLTTGQAQTLEGDWFFRGFYAEVEGGLNKDTNQNFDSGTFNFTNTGGGNYRVSVVDQFETMEFDLVLARSGNTFSGTIPTDVEAGSTSTEEVRIILDGDFAYLISLTWSVSTEAGLVGQSFSYETVGYVLSRNAFPTQEEGRWSGNYAYRLVGQSQIWGQENRHDSVDVVSLTMDADAGGGTAFYQGSNVSVTYQMDSDPLGLGGALTIPLSGTVVDTPGLTVNRDELLRYAMAVQVNATEMVWLQTFVSLGSVNTGTADEYFLLTAAGTLAGRATRTVETAPAITRQPTDISVLSGGEAFFSVDAQGAPAPTYAWEMSLDQGRSWTSLIGFDEANYAGANTATMVVKTDAATNGQRFRVLVSNTAGNVFSDAATLKILAQPTARLPNLSVRTTLAAAQNLAVGFVMTGGSKPLLIRAVGPTLGDFGVGDAMADPRIGFNNSSGVEIDANDDWSASLGTTFNELGAFALADGSKDAALRVDLSGLGTVSVNGPEGGTVLVEVYDIGDSNDTRLANVSARNEVGTGDNILIAGFVVTGADPKNMLIRAVGPGLERFIGSGFLADPLLTIFDADSNVVASNDNWSPSLQPSFDLTGAFELSSLSLDAAIVLTLPPGRYTAQVSGADGGTGQAIVEIYELP